jgi:hypothetical protein
MNASTYFYKLALAATMIAAVPDVRGQQICQTLLQGGVFDTGATSSDTYAADYYRSRYCSSSANSSNGDLNIGLPIGDIPIDFGASAGSSGSQNICDDKTSSYEAWQKYRSWSSQASPVVAKAFVDCVKAEGTQLWTERSLVTNAFSLNARVHYGSVNYPRTKIRFSFTPANAVGTCSPESKAQLEAGVELGNLETFKVVCEMTSHTKGAEIGLISSTQIPYGSMSIRPYRPGPIFAMSTSTDARDGVKTPSPGDATYVWGADTLLTRYDGPKVIPPASGRSWAVWNLANIIPGRYQVLITYAAAESRPLRLLIDGQLALSNVASEPTGSPPDGWSVGSRQQRVAGEIQIDKANVELRLETVNANQAWPHFKELRLVFVSD